MKSWRLVRGWLAAAVLVAGAVAGVRYAAMRPRPIEVRVERAGRGLVEETIGSTKAGAVRSPRVSELSVEAAGAIVAVHAREGMSVTRGATLISIDPRDADAAVAAALAELAVLEALAAEARASLADARRDYERLRGLLSEAAVSRADLDRACGRLEMTTAGAEAAAARVRAQREPIARARIARDKCELRAPFDAVIAERFVEVGEWALPGKVALRALENGRHYVRAEIDEVDIARLVTGLEARVTLDPYKGMRFPGRVTRVAPYVSELEEQNRTAVVDVELTGSLGGVDLKHGTSADVEVVLRRAPDVLRVPTLALLEGNRVLTAGADGRAHARALRIGLRNWEFAEVQEGLAPGEPVIVALESEALVDGALIRVLPAAPSPAAGSTASTARAP